MTIIDIGSRSAFFSSYNVKVTLDGKTYNAILECQYDGGFSVGDTIRGPVLICSVAKENDNANYHLCRDIYISLFSEDDSLTVLSQGYSNFEIKMRRLNSRFSKIFETHIGGDQATLVSAISLGNRNLLNNSILRDFRRTGLSHILAISGMHLSIIMLILEKVLRHLGIRKDFRCVIVFFVALFYLALTGFALSTVRAFIMVSLVYLAFLVRSDNDPVTSLFFSLFLILLISPASVRDLSLWLSFLAVLGILTADYFMQKINDRLYQSPMKVLWVKTLAYLLSAAIVTFAANTFVFFLMWLYFGEYSVIAVLSNLIISPLISTILLVAPIIVLIHFIPLLHPITQLISFLLRGVCELILHTVSWLSHWENITVSLKYPFAGFIIHPATILLFVALILPLRRKIWIPIIPIVTSLLFGGALFAYTETNSQQLTVDYLHFNESEMLVMTTTEHAVICDFSTGSNSYLYQSLICAEERFATEISAVILTHYHAYHISTFAKNADSFLIRKLYLPYPKTADDYYYMKSLIDVAKKARVDVQIFDHSKEFSPAKNITLQLSETAYLKRSTHPTFALTVSAFGDTLTYLAESSHETGILRESIESNLSRSSFVILGSHGPKTKNIITYQNVSEAEYIVVSDKEILSYFAPPNNTKIIAESGTVTFRLGQ